MKYCLFIFSIIFFSTIANAQQEENLWSSYGEVQKKVKNAVARKDYPEAEKLLGEFLCKFTGYPEKVQEKWKEVGGSAYYNLACYLSLQRKTKSALNAFAKALEYGWHNYSHALYDEDLDFIRKEQRFKELMQTIREKGDYLYILQQSGEYARGNNNNRNTEFTYMGPLNSQLVRVRRYFNLDSIAGTGDEISKIKNLLGWVHDVVRHDGTSDSPELKNAIDLVEICRKENRGINCRMMALILNECYLAMGFKSRVVTCMPKVYESDCHVINAVYSDSLHKWIWMDPTFNTWVMDENGLLLGIAEVRERLKKGLPLVLNEEANWNHQIKQTKEKYLEAYMAKNLYYVKCALRSEYDAETYYPGKKMPTYVALLPLGYQLGQDQWSQGITYDVEWFWQAPGES